MQTGTFVILLILWQLVSLPTIKQCTNMVKTTSSTETGAEQSTTSFIRTIPSLAAAKFCPKAKRLGETRATRLWTFLSLGLLCNKATTRGMTCLPHWEMLGFMRE